jgi:Kdo2-lipid IVA lauroyltransferase/acyltransferase
MNWLIRLVARLPFWWLYRLADMLFWLTCYVVRYRRAVVLENLTRSFPTKTPQEIRRIARLFYLNLADIMVETLKSYSISKADLRKRIHFTNPEILQQHCDNGQSVLVMASHLCNWEWQLLGSQAYFSTPMDGVYQPLTNKGINAIMLHIRGKFGHAPIAMQSAVREIVRRKNKTFVYGLVADQTPMPHEKNFYTTFLHQKTPFFLGTARIAEMTQFPVLYLEMKRVKRGYYALTFHTLALPPHTKGNDELIVQYARLLEKNIEENPADWLWSHKRWKYV